MHIKESSCVLSCLLFFFKSSLLILAIFFFIFLVRFLSLCLFYGEPLMDSVYQTIYSKERQREKEVDHLVKVIQFHAYLNLIITNSK